MELMSEAMSAQIPRLILETSKVVSAQMQADQQQAMQEQARSFTCFSQDMKQMKLRQEEVEAHAKAANLKSEGFKTFFMIIIRNRLNAMPLFFLYKNNQVSF